ncbi:amino acid/polyamine/organocation transporter (APC superfamily) [Acinetobacter calcoaceticus]|uniref:Amino acid/polyamine/organocation transporter (APC superfamily) n=1 Tax=Acinetobacter calcoaceticus TaxID=471 RepID=A0A4R1Y2Y5_ACICA|nr:amino acid/polyamine/organocation transporter (APC superfamily) [Acinetobacter calcoaceticus]
MDQPTQKEKLTGSLGPMHIVGMVMAAAAPLTVVGGNIPLAMGLGNGIGAPFAFLVASLVLLVFAIGFVSMTPYVKEAGAFYSYIRLGIGQNIAKGTAYVALLTYTAIQAGIYGFIGWAINDLIVTYGGNAHPWWLYSILTIAVVALFGYRNIALSSKVLGISLILEIAVMLILNTSILLQGGAAGIHFESFEFKYAFAPGLSLAILFALTGFIGFESAAIYRDEARDPERTIPKATYWSVLIIGLFYTFSAWAMVIGVGSTQLLNVVNQTLHGSGNMLLDLSQTYNGNVFRIIIQFLLINSLFACVLSFHNILVRYQYTLAQHGDFSQVLVTLHPKYRSPANSSVMQTCIAIAVILICAFYQMEPLTQVFGYMAGVSTIGCMMLMLLTSIAAYVYFYQHPHLRIQKKFKTQVAPALAMLLLGLCLLMILFNFKTLTGGSLLVCLILALVAPLFFVIGLIRQRQVSKSKNTEMPH